MGIDLRLLIVEGSTDDCRFAHTMIDAGGGYDLYNSIQKAKPFTRPEWRLTSFCARIPDGSLKDESGYGEVKETPYGEPLTYLTAEKLIKAEIGMRKEALAFLKALPPHKIIGLYWH